MAEIEGKLTTGSIPRVLTNLSVPIVAAAFLSTAYSITDMAWMGLLGGEILAGVGVGSMYVWLSQGLATLAKMGGQVLIGQELGRGNEEGAREYAAASIKMTILFGLLFGAICLMFTDQLVAFFALEGKVAIEAAGVYMKITCGLIVFSYLGQVLTGVYTAQGDSRTPLKASFIGLVLNMILDPIFMFGVGPIPRMETVGAAVATVLAQVIVVVVLIQGIHSDKYCDNIMKKMKFWQKTEVSYWKMILKMGGPSAIQGTVYCAISMVLSRMAGKFGDTAIAVLRVGGQIESVTWNIANGFSSAMNAFAAQNYGARKMDRVKEGYKISFWIVVVWSLLMTALFFIFPNEISGIFFHTAEEIAVSARYLLVIGVGEVFMCVELLSVGAISGLGNTKLCSQISISLTIMRIPLALVLCETALKVDGLWWALTISSICKGIIFYFTFYRECQKREGDNPSNRLTEV